MKRYSLSCVILLFLLPLTNYAQFQFEFVTDVPVVVADDTLRNAWAGGLNAGQYSTIDLNRDGQSDLVVFDRTSNKLNTFLLRDGQYVYDPAYEALFPDDLRNWVLLADYNCDGRQDIFTNASSGIRVFENTSDEILSFELVADPVTTEGSSGTFNLRVNASDIPGIVDVDGDGDLDILTFDFASRGTVEYHQNQSQETDDTCDHLNYRRITRRWGDFEECFCGEYAFGEPCSAIGGRIAKTEHVGGKSILTLDQDGDGDQDLIFGDETCTSLVYLENEGTAEQALFLSAADTFPVVTDPANGFFFPASYRVEVTSDELPDVIVAPNVLFNLQQSIDLAQSSWLYRNQGTAERPRFELLQRDFLQDEMIDQGAYAAPALGDYDGDGDDDLLLGAESTAGQARLRLYENVGTPTAPAFRLADDDYLNLSAEGFTSLKPLLADVNSDGRIDLVLQSSGTGVLARLSYVPNQSSGSWDFSLPPQPLNVTMVEFDTPFFFDVDQNGRTDLLIGRVTGRLEYFRNEGNGTPSFVLETDSLAGIRNDPFRRNLTPWVGDLDGNGAIELLTTDGSGVMRVYEDFLSENPVVTTSLLRYGNEAVASRWGARTWLAGADLFGTGRPALVVGHVQGGVYLLASAGDGPSPGAEGESLSLSVFPNPNTGSDEIKVKVSQPAQLFVYSVSGRVVRRTDRLLPGITYTLGPPSLARGVYLFKAVSNDGQTAVQRLIVQ